MYVRILAPMLPAGHTYIHFEVYVRLTLSMFERNITTKSFIQATAYFSCLLQLAVIKSNKGICLCHVYGHDIYVKC